MLMSLLVVLLALGTVMISFIALRTSVHWLTLQVRTPGHKGPLSMQNLYAIVHLNRPA